MKKVLLEIFGGLLGLGAGIYVGYIFLNTLNDNPNLLLLVLSVILVGAGVFLFVKSGKSDASIVVKPTVDTSLTPKTAPTTFEKYSDIISKWRKTDEQKARMQMLEMSAAAQAQQQQQSGS